MGKYLLELLEICCLYWKCIVGKKIGKFWDLNCNYDIMDRWNERIFILIRSFK